MNNEMKNVRLVKGVRETSLRASRPLQQRRDRHRLRTSAARAGGRATLPLRRLGTAALPRPPSAGRSTATTSTNQGHRTRTVPGWTA
jgi:hypothetical protein